MLWPPPLFPFLVSQVPWYGPTPPYIIHRLPSPSSNCPLIPFYCSYVTDTSFHFDWTIMRSSFTFRHPFLPWILVACHISLYPLLVHHGDMLLDCSHHSWYPRTFFTSFTTPLPFLLPFCCIASSIIGCPHYCALLAHLSLSDMTLPYPPCLSFVFGHFPTL